MFSSGITFAHRVMLTIVKQWRCPCDIDNGSTVDIHVDMFEPPCWGFDGSRWCGVMSCNLCSLALYARFYPSSAILFDACQTYRSDTNLAVAFTPGCARECSSLKACLQNYTMRYGRATAMLMSQYIVVIVPGIGTLVSVRLLSLSNNFCSLGSEQDSPLVPWLTLCNW